ncbi:MAG TPA: DUF6351 family protein [Burkholderiaceae bacterium]|nr:DUF6351 family protein [Burkholderiaceae bacterium]
MPACVRICVLVLGACLATALSSAQANDKKDELEIVTLSNRADLISGGDALVEVRASKHVALDKVRVTLNGHDVTAAFTANKSAGTLRGLVTSLAIGDNDLAAEVDQRGRGHDARAHLRITNHPIGGPVLSGEQIKPFFCATTVPQAATATSPATNASGLPTPAFDDQCNMVSDYKLYYRTTAAGCSLALPDPSPSVPFLSTNPPTSATPPANPCFKTYIPGMPPPADLATTTTDTGVTVPYIVRVERGTMNRGIYDIAVLFDPTQPWTGVAPQAQWNGKIYYQFGASTGQPRRQFRTSVNWTADLQLARGYLVAQNSMTDSSSNSNRVMMTETVMMMKEYIGDHYGPVDFTLGTGCSGGSINSNTNASIAPGQLDGIVVFCTYPDSETTGIEVADCVVLVEAYQKPQWLALMAGLTQDQINTKKAAINGHLDQTGCHGWYNAFGSNGKAGNYVQRFVISNATGAIASPGAATNNCQLPLGLVYDPVTNPTGQRCSAWDWSASIFGKTADGLRALDTRDNTGVQYGLKALIAGAISPEEFVTLNEIAGGADHDSNPQAARTTADLDALKTAYRSGVVMSGRQLAKTAVIDMRGWDDSALLIPPGNTAPSTIPIHYVWRSFSIRERLDREFGDHDNQVLWRYGRTGLLPPVTLALEAFTTMDTWLTALTADSSRRSVEQKVRRTKPANAFDFCLLSGDVTQSTKVTDTAKCDADQFLQRHSSPRQVAGGSLSENVLKCQLKPLNAADYAPVVFTSEQWARLQAAFADGVCDWSKRGVGQRAARSPLTFADGPGGKPLGRAPSSHEHESHGGHGHDGNDGDD